MAAAVEEARLLAWLRGPAAAGPGDSELSAYVAELAALGLAELGREPARLAAERARVGAETRRLAFEHYRAFIRSAECTGRAGRGFGGIESRLGSLLGRLPALQDACRNFMRDAEEIACSRRMNSLTLNRHTEILEILEIPQLMDTCVRNGYYEEALELAAYVRRLERKHSSIPVIQGIVDEVRQSTQLMLNQLIQQLRTNIQLPACLRVIGYLRRMDVFTEAELRIKFLQARDTWLRSIQASIPDDDPYFHITKTIEAYRVHLFDIVTQYRAIFSDEEPLLPTEGQALNEGAIFHSWVLQKVSEFLRTLEHNLQRGVGGRLDSLLGQCMYFGLSFSRVGADFRGQLAPLFQQMAASSFRKAVEEAVEKFREEMNSYTLISAPAVLGGSTGVPVPAAQPGTLQPPMVLLDFPPLACFLNGLLVAFNDLRLCCPVALAQDITACLEDALSEVTKTILAFHRAEEAAFSGREQELFAQFCTAFLEDLLPYLNRCLQVLFPPAQIAQALGVPPTQLQRFGRLGRIDVVTLREPLALLLPAPGTEEPAQESTPHLEGDEEAVSGEPLPLPGQESPPGGALLPDVTAPTGGRRAAPCRGAPPGRRSCARREASMAAAALAAGRRLAGRARAGPPGRGCGDAAGWGERERSYWRALRRRVLGPPAPPFAAPCQVGAPVLRAAAAAVAPERLGGPELRELAAALAAGLRRGPCLGLSAPQLGVPLRVFAAELPADRCRRYPPGLRRAHRIEPFPLRLLVNPALRVLDARLVTGPEGCASLKGFSAYVPRHWAVHVSGVDVQGEPVSWEATGWAARIIQHEMDHLDGVLYIDRMDTRTFTNVGWMELLD
ncbi:conserved oligomeric Golgi complex subunit 8 [Cariama cristata]